MADILQELVEGARASIREGYYDDPPKVHREHESLKGAIGRCPRAAIIAEVKFASPSRGVIRERGGDETKLAEGMVRGGATGISILTEPKHFGGSLQGFASIARSISAPLLMKDMIIDEAQIDAARAIGADAILLIYPIFREGYHGESVDGLIESAHRRGLEVLLESHSREELEEAVETDADLFGINNRDLKTMEVDIRATERALAGIDLEGKTLVSESGISRQEEIRYLRKLGVSAFLVGTSIMTSDDIEAKVRELVEAL